MALHRCSQLSELCSTNQWILALRLAVSFIFHLERLSTSSVLLGDAVGGADLVTESVVLVGKTLALLLQRLKLTVLLPQSLLELRNLAKLTSIAKTRLALLALGVASGEALVLLLKAQNFEDHGVGAVEDEGEEESEAAQVHVALRVELAGLNLHALATGDGAVTLVSGLLWKFKKDSQRT